MVLLTHDIRIDYPKAFARARKDKMRVVWLEDNLVYVARRAKGHGQYLVRFFVTPSVSGEPQVKMRCNEITGPPCKGTQFGEEMCAHIASVCLRGKNKQSKRTRKAA